MAVLHHSDKALVRRMQAADERAFDEFFDTYFPGLYRFALPRAGGDPQAAEEIAQATICKAIRKLATYRGEASLFTWLCTFCRHEISDFFRCSRRFSARVDLIDDVPDVRAALESFTTPDDDPATSLQRQEVARWVHVTLDHLPRHYGQALEWKYMQELSVKEIARRLGVGPKAAESLLTRARNAFRESFVRSHALAEAQTASSI